MVRVSLHYLAACFDENAYIAKHCVGIPIGAGLYRFRDWRRRVKKKLFPSRVHNHNARSIIRKRTLPCSSIYAEVVDIDLLVEDHPLGYPKVAAFLDSDDSFMIYQRFGFLHSRLLLYKQDELRELEDELHEMDKRDWQDGGKAKKSLKCRDIDDARTLEDGRQSRKELLGRIEKKICEYGMLYARSRSQTF